jgi:hypothetical protein
MITKIDTRKSEHWPMLLFKTMITLWNANQNKLWRPIKQSTTFWMMNLIKKKQKTIQSKKIKLEDIIFLKKLFYIIIKPNSIG